MKLLKKTSFVLLTLIGFISSSTELKAGPCTPSNPKGKFYECIHWVTGNNCDARTNGTDCSNGS